MYSHEYKVSLLNIILSTIYHYHYTSPYVKYLANTAIVL